MTTSLLVKICGLTRLADAEAAASAGADLLGYILVPSSKRHVDIRNAAMIVQHIRGKFPAVLQFGVVMDLPVDECLDILRQAKFDGLQLHGSEPASTATAIREAGHLVIKAVPIGPGAPSHDWANYPCDYHLADTFHENASGGTGLRLDPALLPPPHKRGPSPMLLAGGLNPANLAEAVKPARPDGVDVSSGVEISPGIKNHDAIRDFVARVHS